MSSMAKTYKLRWIEPEHAPVSADELPSRILPTFGPMGTELRMVSGIASDAKVPEVQAKAFIEQHPQLFKRFPISLGGEPVYEMRRDSKEFQTVFESVSSSVS